MKTTVTKSFSILIVDDNPKNLQVLANFLQEEKYEIEFAISGEAALKWVKKKKFDLILLDINMPGMNGLEVCRRIRSDRSLDKVPVIFISAESDRESKLKGFETGAQDYVTKPFDSRELIARVKTHLSLKESQEKLEVMNLSLEEKVKERTSQLTEANLKLNELDKAKSEFLQMISHEIRTPLNGIVTPLYLLKEMEMSTEIIPLVEILDESVKRLERFSLIALLITQIRTEAGKISGENILLVDLVNKCLTDNEIENLLKDKNIEVDVSELSSESKLTGNINLLKTCIKSILENAIKYSDQDGHIQIKNREEKNSVILEIEDEGQGFPQKKITVINDLLASDELVINFNVGLGLNLAKYIMAHHSGKVEVTNKNPGACVKLLFSGN